MAIDSPVTRTCIFRIFSMVRLVRVFCKLNPPSYNCSSHSCYLDLKLRFLEFRVLSPSTLGVIFPHKHFLNKAGSFSALEANYAVALPTCRGCHSVAQSRGWMTRFFRRVSETLLTQMDSSSHL